MTLQIEPLEKYLENYNADDTPIRDIIRAVKLGPERVWIAGGAARRLYSNLPLAKGDIDVAFQRGPTLHRRRDALEKRWGDYHYSGNSTSYTIPSGIKVQLLHRLYKDIGSMFNYFDISVCKFATDGINMFSTEQAREDVANGVFTVKVRQERDWRSAWSYNDPRPAVWVPDCLTTRMFKYFFMGFMPHQKEVLDAMHKRLRDVLGFGSSNKKLKDTFTKNEVEYIVNLLSKGPGSSS